PALARAAGEKQGEHDDVVDVGHDEQADCLQDGSQDHATTSAASHLGTEQAGSMHGAFSSNARGTSTRAVSARVRCGSATSWRGSRRSGAATTIPPSVRPARALYTSAGVRSRSRAGSAG